jgi:NitT/TauT family transport system substrate-binding protein
MASTSASRRTVLRGAAGSLLGLAIAPMLAACGDDAEDTSPTGGKLEDFSFNLGFIALGRYAPYYYTRELGFYQDRGLNVKLDPSSGAAAATKLILAGQTNAAYISMVGMLKAMSESSQVLARNYATIHPGDLNTIFFYKGEGITAPKDLEGRTIVTSAGSDEFNSFGLFAKATGIDEKKVKWRNVDSSTKVGLLTRREAEVVTSGAFSLAQLTLAKKNSEEIGTFVYGDYGVADIYRSIVMLPEWVEGHKSQARAFVEGTLEGYKAAFKDIPASIKAMKKHITDLDEDTAKFEMDMLEKLVIGPDQVKNGIGYTGDANAKQTYDDVTVGLGRPVTRPYTDFYSNEFIPGASTSPAPSPS